MSRSFSRVKAEFDPETKTVSMTEITVKQFAAIVMALKMADAAITKHFDMEFTRLTEGLDE
jgi:hypothetical protein